MFGPKSCRVKRRSGAAISVGSPRPSRPTNSRVVRSAILDHLVSDRRTFGGYPLRGPDSPTAVQSETAARLDRVPRRYAVLSMELSRYGRRTATFVRQSRSTAVNGVHTLTSHFTNVSRGTDATPAGWTRSTGRAGSMSGVVPRSSTASPSESGSRSRGPNDLSERSVNYV